jgi:hypothetical protein
MAAYSPVIEGTHYAPAVFSDGAPGYVQYRISLAEKTRQVTIEYTPAIDGMSGIGAKRGDVSVALRAGSDPITWDYTTGKAVSTAQLTKKGEPEGSTSYKLTLSGSCIDKGQGGDLVFQFINHGTQTGLLTMVKVTQSPDLTETSTAFDCP